MMKHTYPGATHWADSTYNQNSEEAKTWLENRVTEEFDSPLQQK
jgi:hypothetical protein